ncbi:MAG: phosphotransferase family protein [Micromonosporaceae bacterium]|nr:phosphotransferase family protein [Micromonosporaceae bacterium]
MFDLRETTSLGAGLAARVARALGEVYPGVPVGPLVRLPAGQAGETYHVCVGSMDLIVKAVPAPARPVGRHDMLRQAAMLRALAGSAVPVPSVVAVDTVPPAWFAMTWIAGEAVEPVLDDIWIEPVLARQRMLAAARLLGRMHQLAVGALRIHRPPEEDPATHIRRWSRLVAAVPDELCPGGLRLAERLAWAVPARLPAALLHGDFRLGNILAAQRRICALIDWETWTVGDPRIDLAWFLIFADHTNFPGLGRETQGLPNEAELVERYLGEREPLPDLDWFRAVARLKMAAIMAHNLRRHRAATASGATTGVGERLPATIERLIQSGSQIATTLHTGH